ncbi:MAG: hypothetical protein RIA69_13835 [Cyclobacteriaceae bacterium]
MKYTTYLLFTIICLSSCKLAYQRQAIGSVHEPSLNEISGIVPSVKHKDHFWVINDSGDAPNLYLINANGALVATITVNNAQNYDWEALALDPANGVIYIGDIGDNQAKRDTIQIYKVVEPDFGQTSIEATKMNLVYEEGARDAETLMFDPKSQQLVLVTKRELRTHLYQFPFIEGHQSIRSLGRINHTYFTGGDISPEGDVLIKNYWRTFLWSAKPKISIAKMITKKRPQKVRYKKEIQGEAICWSLGGDSFFTLSEMGEAQKVPFFKYQK